MKCKACGYEGETFPRTPMGKYCCPQCGAEQTGSVLPMEDDYAEQLRKVRQTAVADLERRKQDAEYANQSQMEAEAKHRQEAEAKKNKEFDAKFNELIAKGDFAGANKLVEEARKASQAQFEMGDKGIHNAAIQMDATPLENRGANYKSYDDYLMIMST